MSARSPYAGEKVRSPFSNIEMNMEGGSGGDQDDDDEPVRADGGEHIEEYP